MAKEETINWKKVKSTQIDSVFFNVKEQALLIKFKKGAIWHYSPFDFTQNYLLKMFNRVS